MTYQYIVTNYTDTIVASLYNGHLIYSQLTYTDSLLYSDLSVYIDLLFLVNMLTVIH